MTNRMRRKYIKRMKSLIPDTSLSIEHICNSLINVFRYLLSNGFNFVRLGEITTDYLNKLLVAHILSKNIIE